MVKKNTNCSDARKYERGKELNTLLNSRKSESEREGQFNTTRNDQKTNQKKKG